MRNIGLWVLLCVMPSVACADEALLAVHQQFLESSQLKELRQTSFAQPVGCTAICRAVRGSGQSDAVCRIASSQPSVCATYPGCTYEFVCDRRFQEQARVEPAGCTFICRAVRGGGASDATCRVMSSNGQACMSWPGCTYEMVCDRRSQADPSALLHFKQSHP